MPNRHALPLLLLLAVLSHPVAAIAGKSSDSQSESQAATAGAASETEKQRSADGAPHSKAPLDGRVETQERSVEESPTFRVAIQKLIAKEKLTSDDYRSLGIGVLGIHAERNLFSNRAEITALIPGCPAANAGIKVHDWEIINKDPESQSDSHGLTQFTCGLAGKPVDLTIKRNGHTLQFHLVRMNIEDIPDDRVRRYYEHLVDKMRSKLARAYPELDPRVFNH